MVCAGVLGGFVLVTLLLSGSRGEDPILDQNTLVPVITFLQKYQPKDGQQYAIAFNAPADKCGDYLDQSFLKQYPQKTVKGKLNSEERLYKGDRLIAARPKPIPGTQNNQHSEYRLMKLPNTATSPMANLLNKDKKGCVVFYTYNSPCTSTCINPRNCYNIFDALDIFQKHEGQKAFVFTQVWQHDCDKDISTNLKEVMKRVPLYRCRNRQCVRCEPNNLNMCTT
ncbi:hypothetical protein ACEWY4_008469 [Coilia grayii]|uniref:Uncharacterized protein n=1 Tax=Coilia grayii TaxID=363190 RepID=A0ABD1KB73_9TELE